MEISLTSQVGVFFMSVFVGLILSIVYDLSYAVCLIFNINRKKIFIRDILYFIFCGIITFLFILAVNFGEIRFYIIIGELLGWCLYQVTIGGIISFWVKTIKKFIKRKSKLCKNFIPEPVLVAGEKLKKHYFDIK